MINFSFGTYGKLFSGVPILKHITGISCFILIAFSSLDRW